MNKYYIATDKIDLKCYPNYSFEIGDVDGDGRMEFVSMNQSATLLSVFNLDGGALFEKNLDNTGNWGTTIICVADIDGDGRDEIIVPDGGSIVAFDGKGNKIREYKTNSSVKDCYGASVPLIGAARIKSPDELSIVAVLAKGEVVALDRDFNEIWKIGGMGRDYGHEIFFADVDGDGLDEISFCTIGCAGQSDDGWQFGELLLLDHDGKTLLRRIAHEYFGDNHADDTAMADFTGDGTCQILIEKGILIDLNGNVIWDLCSEMEHGQWIAHTPNPNGKGKLVFISELWGNAMKSMLFTGQGKVIKKIKDIKNLPWPKPTIPEMRMLPTRAHMVRWDGKSEPEIFLAQQAIIGSHDSTETHHYQLTCLFMDLQGNLVGELPFNDSQIKGYFYNGEVHSRVADIDGDGEQEIVFTKQDGHVMIIKKKI